MPNLRGSRFVLRSVCITLLASAPKSFVVAQTLSAQSRALPAAVGTGRSRVEASTIADPIAISTRISVGPVPQALSAPWWAPLSSALLPGSGQLALRQQRSVVYAVAEAYLLLQTASLQRDYQRERQRYRALASDVADSGRSVILDQVANGVAVRMAVLYLLLGGHPWEGES